MVAVVLVAWALAVAPEAGAPAGTFVPKTIELHGRTWRYSVYLPPGHQPGQELPVILALHGAGARGTDGLRPQIQGVVTAAQAFPERYRAVLVLPHCPPDQSWSGDVADVALAALERTLQEYGGDRRRLYLVGQSLGARGAVDIATLHPHQFAAVVAVAGRHLAPEQAARRLKSMPLWAWHGDADAEVPVARSRALVEALRAAGSQGVRYTELPGRGHYIFDTAFRDEELSRWLFAQRREG
ncbi:carboxylesterase family protein [Hyalangium gracile]|uniref:carboxylesterase family protein n=1 Tax=Hyalangium gracile TaxID=394092 RepID=UPI001CD01B32|nr:alpha/beta hydrolase-fold protein [Hyalangium gracile]